MPFTLTCKIGDTRANTSTTTPTVTSLWVELLHRLAHTLPGARTGVPAVRHVFW